MSAEEVQASPTGLGRILIDGEFFALDCASVLAVYGDSSTTGGSATTIRLHSIERSSSVGLPV